MMLKFALLLLYTLLALTGSGETASEGVTVPSTGEDSFLVEEKADLPGIDQASSFDMCLTSAQGWTFSGNSNGSPVSVRIIPGHRSSNSAQKSGRWFCRCGRKMDSNTLKLLFSPIILKWGGQFSYDRFIFSICTLRL